MSLKYIVARYASCIQSVLLKAEHVNHVMVGGTALLLYSEDPEFASTNDIDIHVWSIYFNNADLLQSIKEDLENCWRTYLSSDVSFNVKDHNTLYTV